MQLRLLKKRKAREPGLRQPAPIAVPRMNEAEMAAVYHGERMGGDFYDFLRVSPHLVLFGLLDVAGRHQENQNIVSAAQQTFRTMGTKMFSSDDINESTSMLELSLQLNRTIMQAAGGVRSCPAFVGAYNELLGTVCYSNAGHTPALLRDHAGITQLPATGLPFGLFSHVTHDAPTAALEPGAVLLLVSRGVTEGKCQGEEFGLEGVQKTLQKATISNAEQLCGDILDSVEQFMCARPTHNDVTALALVRLAAAKAAGA
ncbi:MAG TPA: SpoIIE family protein phosphatase [Terriglobales bacterium]|nr:SpoIIE family protein phosphatase [Terriglobales bacterium]